MSLNKKTKVLLIAYQFSPARGSEYSVGWNHAKFLSDRVDITLVYGAAGEHMGDLIKKGPEESALTKLNLKEVIALKPNFLTNLFNFLNKFNIFPWSFYFAYKLWHRQCFKLLSKRVSAHEFDVVHFLNPIGYREPGYFWKLNTPYVWGPIGGAVNMPTVLLKSLNKKDQAKYFIKKILNQLQLQHSLRVRKAFKASSLILAATSENKEIFKKFFNVDMKVIPENAIDIEPSVNFSKISKNTKLNLIWIGKIEARKALNVLLVAISKMTYLTQIRLDIIGTGPLKNASMKLAKDLGINESIVWHGGIPRSEVFKLLDKAHLHVITSFSEGNPTTIWEALSKGVPILSLNHCGMRDVLSNGGGILIDINDINMMSKEISIHLDSLVNDHNHLERLTKEALICAKNNSWKNRIEFFENLYSDLKIND